MLVYTWPVLIEKQKIAFSSESLTSICDYCSIVKNAQSDFDMEYIVTKSCERFCKVSGLGGKHARRIHTRNLVRLSSTESIFIFKAQPVLAGSRQIQESDLRVNRTGPNSKLCFRAT